MKIKYYTGSTIEKQVSNMIEWNFSSVSSVKLLIIKKTTFNYFNRVATETAKYPGSYYEKEWGELQ